MELKRHVLALIYGFTAALAFAAAGSGDIRQPGTAALSSPLLAPLNMLLQWLATQPELIR